MSQQILGFKKNILPFSHFRCKIVPLFAHISEKRLILSPASTLSLLSPLSLLHTEKHSINSERQEANEYLRIYNTDMVISAH